MGCGFVAVVPEAGRGRRGRRARAHHPGAPRIGTVTDRAGEASAPGGVRLGVR